ncbi:MAG: hypothetical protein AB8B55_13290 [Mariniblastus sp.]
MFAKTVKLVRTCETKLECLNVEVTSMVGVLKATGTCFDAVEWMAKETKYAKAIELPPNAFRLFHVFFAVKKIEADDAFGFWTCR